MKQLTLEDVAGSFDYTAKSTAEQFLAKPSVIRGSFLRSRRKAKDGLL